MKISAITSTIAIFFSLLILAVLVTLIVLVIRALLKYLKSKEVRDEKKVIKRSLGEALKFHRTRCKMTQEFECKMTQEFVAKRLVLVVKLCQSGRKEILTPAHLIYLHSQNYTGFLLKNF